MIIACVSHSWLRTCIAFAVDCDYFAIAAATLVGNGLSGFQSNALPGYGPPQILPLQVRHWRRAPVPVANKLAG
jgi:hypothetical protein